MKLFIEKSRFRVGAGERKRLWWRTEQTICLYYQKIIQIRIDILCLRQAQAPKVTRWLSGVEITGRNKNLPSTSSGTESSSKYNTVIERSRNHRDKYWKMCLRELRSQTFSLCSGIGSVTEGWNIIPVIERSRNHQRNNIKRWLSGVEATTMKNLSYKYLKICYFFRKFRYSIK